MARLAINETERKLKVGVLTAIPGQPVAVEEFPLQSAKPASEVLSTTFLESVREHAGMDAGKFIEQIMSIESESVDIFDLVEKAASQKGVKKEVINYILSKRP